MTSATEQQGELHALRERLQAREAEIDRLGQELAETNRGVLALYAELDDRAQALGQMSETKTRFLSDMSHELRAPLASMINLTRLLLARADGPLTTEQEYQVTLVQRSAESLSEMVNDLLDIAKIEARKVDLRLEEVSVAEIFAGLRGMFRPLATNEQVALVFEDPDEPIVLTTDAQRVAQVLRNFVSNALKFTTEGEVRVAARAVDDDSVRLDVSDTGVGIAPEDHSRIFEDFTQVDGPIQKRVRGTGLGLPLTRKLARLLGGEIQLESRPGEGSRFSLVIPRVHPGPEATR
jgi:signal transduction histidine kinase